MTIAPQDMNPNLPRQHNIINRDPRRTVKTTTSPSLGGSGPAGGVPHRLVWARRPCWPWPATLVRLFTDSVFDDERLPLLTVLVGAGAVVLWRTRHRPAVCHWLLLTAATALLFLGRTNSGSVYDRLPLHGQVNVMRYPTGVHICGLIAAALAALSERSRPLLRRAHPAAVAAGGLGDCLAWGRRHPLSAPGL